MLKTETERTAAAPETTLSFRHLRVVKASNLANYVLMRPQLLHTWRWRKSRNAEAEHQPTDEVIYHSFRPGFLRVPLAAGRLARELASGKADASTSDRHRRVAEHLASLGWCRDETVDLDGLLAKTRDIFPAVQNPRELRALLELVAKQRPRVVVEIGTASGGTFYCLSQLAHPEALMVSLDIEGGAYGGGQSVNDTLVFSSFGPPGQSFQFLRQRSFHLSTLHALEKILDGRSIDLLVIDADHSYAGVKSDFEMYGRLVADDGLTALHDIHDFPHHMKAWREGNDVHTFWRELVDGGWDTREIIDPGVTSGDSPDELWETRWPAIGFGVVRGNRPRQPSAPPSRNPA